MAEFVKGLIDDAHERERIAEAERAARHARQTLEFEAIACEGPATAASTMNAMNADGWRFVQAVNGEEGMVLLFERPGPAAS